jgi:hypothetical protein
LSPQEVINVQRTGFAFVISGAFIATFTPAAFAGFYGEPATVDLYVTG